MDMNKKWHMNEDPTLQKAHFMVKWIARVKIACHRNEGSGVLLPVKPDQLFLTEVQCNLSLPRQI